MSKSATAAPPLPSKFQTLRSGDEKQYAVMVPAIDYPLREIHEKIPSQYFKRIMWKGFYYVARDIVQSIITYFLMTTIGYSIMAAADSYLPYALATAARVVMWNAFWFIQGLNWTGLWVLAHECGHQSFSDYRFVNDTVGFILHSFLLVPYHSWRITHGNHHKHTNHLTKDTVFIPEQRESIREAMMDAPAISIAYIVGMLTVGWPLYLVANVAGQVYPQGANHFNPASPLFVKKDAADIVISDVGMLAMLGAVGVTMYHQGFVNVWCLYLAPYMWVNFWLVLITFLQHSDIRVPHYTPDQWTFVRGALATVDRDFGAAINWWLHHIHDSHVVHHLFSQMPFYHAIEVTRHHLKGILGPLYLTDSRPLLTMLWESWRECQYVVPHEGVMIFRH